MDFRTFKQKFDRFPIINYSLLKTLKVDNQTMRNQLTRWVKHGLLLKLRRGLYMLNTSDAKRRISRVFLANELYQPSYVSMEYALAYYELIPEKVSDITSVTARKTMTFNNTLGSFRYQHITQRAFTGFILNKDEYGNPYMIATPEKACVDFMYLNLPRFRADDMDVFEQSFRFQNIKSLMITKLKSFAVLYNSRKLMCVINNFAQFRRNQ